MLRHRMTEERFWEKTDVRGEDECWPTKFYRKQGGYGVCRWNNKRLLAHRKAYELVKGPIPEGLVVDHICKNPPCCNPSHLRAVTNRFNVIENSVSLWALNAKKTHCVRGHEFTEKNTKMTKGKRSCRECARIRSAYSFEHGSLVGLSENWDEHAKKYPHRTKIVLDVGGVALSLKEWSEVTGISRAALGHRIASGMSPEEVISRPLRTTARR